MKLRPRRLADGKDDLSQSLHARTKSVDAIEIFRHGSVESITSVESLRSNSQRHRVSSLGALHDIDESWLEGRSYRENPAGPSMLKAPSFRDDPAGFSPAPSRPRHTSESILRKSPG